MNGLIHQSTYAKSLRAELPKAAFAPDLGKLYLLVINLAILGCGWGIGAQLHHWPAQWLWLYLPFALVMANSVMFMAFGSHDMMHGSVTRNRKLAYGLAVLTHTVLWMPPTLWKIVHNRIHHNKTNQLEDPDRNYFLGQPNTIGKRLQALLFPSSTMALPGLAVSLMTVWGIYALRNSLSILIWNGKSPVLAPAPMRVTQREKLTIVGELAVITLLHLGILTWLAFNPLQIALAYFLPIALGHAGMMAYIFTHHLVCPITEINDPLVNTRSLLLPKWIDALHLNFSHHAEHHIFPGLNSDYYPQVRKLLYEHEHQGYVVSASEAWQMLLSTHRLYLDNVTLTDWQGQARSFCHLLSETDESQSKI